MKNTCLLIVAFHSEKISLPVSDLIIQGFIKETNNSCEIVIYLFIQINKK